MRTGRSQFLVAALAALTLLTGGSPARAQSVQGPTGPKKRVAVAKFDAAGAFLAAYGGWDLGGGLAAQLATELMRTGRFVVLERAELAGVLREQEMGLQKIITPRRPPRPVGSPGPSSSSGARSPSSRSARAAAPSASGSSRGPSAAPWAGAAPAAWSPSTSA